MPFKVYKSRTGLNFAPKKKNTYSTKRKNHYLYSRQITIQKKRTILDSSENTHHLGKTSKTNEIHTETDENDISADSFKMPLELLFDLECSMLEDNTTASSDTISDIPSDTATPEKTMSLLLPIVVSELKHHGQLEVLEKLFRLVSEVNSQLPYINISQSDVEKYPDFCSLLSNLTSEINPDGLSVLTAKDLKQAEEISRHEKLAWLREHVLYLELQEMLLDYELRSQDVSLSSRDQQFYQILQHSLTLAEIEDYLEFSPDPSSKVTTLGLTRDELARQDPYKKHMSSLEQALIPEMEERLRKKCENLVVAHDPQNSSSDSTRLTFAKSSQLPVIVETDKLRLEELKTQLASDHRKREKQFNAYYQKLLECLELLEEMISRYKLQEQAEHDTIMAETLHAKCDAMAVKIRLVELQIFLDTYTLDTVQSLRIIRKHLNDACKESEKEKLLCQQALRAYDSAGEGFDDIVAEFGKFKSELENKQWALAEFDKSNKKGSEG